MSRFVRAPSIFRERQPPRRRLRALVQGMTRARHRQLLLDRVAASVLVALVAAVAWVLLARFTSLVMHAGAGVAGLLLLALAAGVLSARARRPDELEVAIESDLQLGLQQTLSTAWELETRGAEPALVERLAEQAMHAQGLPRTGESVFPLQLSGPAKLVPLAALALVLASVIEPLPETVVEAPAAADAILAQEGERLREHGLAMERRARREGLARSTEESIAMQRLGNHMRDGLLARGEALVRLRTLGANLREQRRAAAGEAGATTLAPGALRDLAESWSRDGEPLRELLDGLASGTLAAAEARALAERALELAGAAIGTQEMHDALRQLEEGDAQALRRLLERLSRVETALREIEELQHADEEVRRARLSLGEDDDPGQRRLGLLEGEPGEGDAVRLLRGDGRHPGAGALRVPGYGPARGSGDSPRATDTGAEPRDTTRSAAAVLRPRSRHGEGEVRSSEARVLPGAGQARIEPVALQRPFASQVEEVLSKEEVPLHHKELVRRYFDSLGAAAGTGAGETR